jgi:hypothetical protein
MNLTSKDALLFDELPIVQSFTGVELKDDIFFLTINALSLNIHDRYGQKSYPKENSMDMSPNEYKTFLSELSLTLNFIKKYFNDVILRGGLPFPYNVDEFYTSVKFGPNSLYFLFETEEEYKMTPSHYLTD